MKHTEQSQSRSGKPKRTPEKQTTSKKQSPKSVTPEQRHRMIAETAYSMAESRGFGGGGQLDDWLQAEAMVDRQLSGQQPS